MIYLFILISLLLLSFHFDYQRHTKYKMFFFVSMMILLIFTAGFRYRLGVDTIRYEYTQNTTIEPLYNLTWEYINAQKYDPLYLLLCSFAKTISSEFWVVQILQATLVNVIFFRFIKRNTQHIFFGILIYFIFLYLNFMCEVMREACAVSMLLVGWEYLKKKKLFVFSLWCLIAIGFHTSAIVLLILPIIFGIKLWKVFKINKWTIITLIGVLSIGFIIRSVFFNYILLFNLSERLSEKANSYADSDLAETTLNIIGMLSISIRYIIFPFCAIYLLKKLKNYNKSLSFEYIETLVYLCGIFATISIPIALFYRFNNYFFPFAIIAMSDIVFIKKLYLSKKTFLKCQTFALWLIIFFPTFFLQVYGLNRRVGQTPYKDYMRYYPYSSIFNEEKNHNREQLFFYYGAN